MRKIIYILFSWLLTGTAAQAAIPEMKFRRLDTNNGLSNSQVNCLHRDSRGFVWVGTAYGLNRYDGYRVKTFYSNKNDTTTMRDNYTDQIMEDYTGKLWLKQGMNYCVYNPVTERFERNVGRILKEYGIEGGVERVYIDGKKNFWVKIYDQGYYFYNPTTKQSHHYKLGYGKGEFNPTYGVSTIADYKDGILLVTNCGELVYLNSKKGVVEWDNKWMRENGGPENKDYWLSVDKDDNFWVATEDYTFIYMQKEKRWYKSLPEWLRERGVQNVPDKMLVWDIKVDHRNWLWVATDHDGLFVVDLKDWQMKQFLNNKFDESTISDNTPKHLCPDNRGQMWIGTFKNGVNQYQEGLASIKCLEIGDINTVVEDLHGNYWIGSNVDGIIVYNPKTGETLNHYTKANSPMIGNIMVGSCRAKDGSLWFGSYNGGLIHCIPSKDGSGQATIVNYVATGAPDGLATNNVWSVTEDKWGRIWLGTLGGGIQMLDLKTGKFRTWNTRNTKLTGDYMTSVWWIKKGWLMVGTNWYYCFVNPVTGKLANRVIPDDPNVKVNVAMSSCVMEDSRGLIWQGSSSGATVYDQKTGRVWLLDMTHGLYGSSVCSITEDQEHMMWVVTDHGVSKIIPELQEDGTWQFIVRSYNTRDGLQHGTYNQRSAFLTHDGKILIGGQGGLDIINPKALSNTKSKECPVFSGLQLFDVDVPVGAEVNGRVILDEALDVCRKVTLSFNEQFTIQLASDAGNVNNGKRFVYKMEGFNDNWVKTSELNPNITYNSLRAGSYTLCVRMLNDDGSIGEEESQLEITIRPSFWRTRWMMLLYVLFLLAAAWFWRKWYMKRQERLMEVERKRRELEKKQWMNEMRMQLAHERAADGTRFDNEGPLATESAAETMPLTKMPTDLVDFVRQLCNDYTSIADNRQVKVTFLSAVKDLEVTVDRDKLTEVFHILFRNSAAFSPDDCRISVGVARMQDGRPQIQVADNGIGIKDEYKEHAFDPMVNGDGIGLDRVSDIVKAHGGAIRIDDNPGGGTIFVITLPAEEVVEDAVQF